MGSDDKAADKASWTVAIVGALAGLCFLALSASSVRVLASPRRVPEPYAVIFAVVTAYLAYRGFRAATLGATDEDSIVSSMHTGIVGGLAGLLAFVALYLMFSNAIRVFSARLVGLHVLQVTLFRLLLSFVCLGFAAGFVLRMQKYRE